MSLQVEPLRAALPWSAAHFSSQPASVSRSTLTLAHRNCGLSLVFLGGHQVQLFWPTLQGGRTREGKQSPVYHVSLRKLCVFCVFFHYIVNHLGPFYQDGLLSCLTEAAFIQEEGDPNSTCFSLRSGTV